MDAYDDEVDAPLMVMTSERYLGRSFDYDGILEQLAFMRAAGVRAI